MPDSLITDEIRALIGLDTEPERNRFPISAEMAYDVADAIEDYNPLYVDPDYAEAQPFYGSLLCPPLAAWKDIAPPIGYFGAGQEWHFEVPLPFNSYGLNGGSDWQFLAPVRVGTWITRQFRILDIFEKQGRSGPLVFIVRQEIQTDQEGLELSRARRVSIHRALPSGEEPTDVAQVADDLSTVAVAPPNPEVILPKPEPESQRPTVLRGRIRRRRPASGDQRPNDDYPLDPLGGRQRQLCPHPLGPAFCPVDPGPAERGGQRFAEEPVSWPTAAGLRR